eukprot:2447915-Alexandrium_andersonii.AAC.1
MPGHAHVGDSTHHALLTTFKLRHHARDWKTTTKSQHSSLKAENRLEQPSAPQNMGPPASALPQPSVG